MKSLLIIMFLTAALICSNAFAEDDPINKPSPKEEKLLMDCNLAARNSLINGDIPRVEKTCTEAIKEMERVHPDKGHMINPMMNLAFTYSLTGDYAKAEPLLAKAKKIGEKFYKPGSTEMKSINRFIEDHNKRKGKPAQFDKGSISSPH